VRALRLVRPAPIEGWDAGSACAFTGGCGSR
jgi:hypothetical protein